MRIYKADIELTGSVQSLTSSNIFLGARYRGELSSGLGWFGLADLQKLTLPIIQYTSSKQTEAEVTPQSLYGLRIGGGVTKQISTISIDAMLAQSFALTPADTHIGVGASMPVASGLSARLGLGLDLKGGTIESEGDVEIDVSETEMAITAGAIMAF
jgi:hypothetical protein